MTQAVGQDYCLPIIFKSEMVNDDACSLTGTETHDDINQLTDFVSLTGSTLEKIMTRDVEQSKVWYYIC